MLTLKFDLRRAMLDYEARTGIRLTYDSLSQACNVSSDTLKSMASRPTYNATLKVIGSVAHALRCNPVDYFEWSESDDEREG